MRTSSRRKSRCSYCESSYASCCCSSSHHRSFFNLQLIIGLFWCYSLGLCTAASGGGGGENKETAKGSSSNHLHQQQQYNNGGGGGGSGGYSMEDDDDNHQKLQHRHSGLLAAWPTMPLTKYGSGGGGGGGGNDLHHRHSSTGNAKTSSSSVGGGYIPGPFFEPVFATNVSVLAGQSVLLQCRVMELGDRVVIINSLVNISNIVEQPK